MEKPQQTRQYGGVFPVLIFVLATLFAAGMQVLTLSLLPENSPYQLLIPVLAGAAITICILTLFSFQCKKRCTYIPQLRALRENLAIQQADNARLRRQAAESQRQAIVLQRQIAENHLSDISLKRGETKFQAAFHATPDPILVCNLETGLIIDVNESYLLLFEQDWQNILGEKISHAIQWATQQDKDTFHNELQLSGTLNNLRAISPDKNCTRQFLVSARAIELEGTQSAIIIARDISEMETLRQELAKQTEILQNILRHIPYLIFWKDCDGKYLGANELFRKETLSEPIEIEGLTIEELGISKEEATSDIAEDALVMKTGTPIINKERRIRLPSFPSVRDVLVSKVPLKNNQGGITGVLGIVADVSDIRSHERQFKMLLDSIPDAAWIKNVNGQYRVANQALSNLCGRTTDDVIGKTDFEMFPEEIARQCTANDQQVIQNGEALRTDEPGEFQGTQRWFEVIRQPFAEQCADGTSQITGTIGIARDVSVRRAAENEIRKLSRAVEQTSAAVVITDSQGHIEFVNSRYTEITGYTQDEILGHIPPVLQNAMSDIHYDDIWKELRDGKVWRGEIQSTGKNGEQYWLLASFSPICDDDGNFLQAVMVLDDITQGKEQEKFIRHMAMHDGLTDLPNRRLFIQRLKQAAALYQRNGTRFALLFIDVNEFKAINDTFGHDTGDKVLVAIANRLTHCLREIDTAARLGGDEFVALLHDVGNNDEIISAGNRIAKAIAEPITIKEQSHNITAAIGMAICPEHGTDADTLLNKADDAMYSCKRSGQCNVVTWKEE